MARARSKPKSENSWKDRIFNLDLSMAQRNAVIAFSEGYTSESRFGGYLTAIEEGWSIKQSFSVYHGAVTTTVGFPDGQGYLYKKMVMFTHPSAERGIDIALFVINDLYPSGHFAEGYKPAAEDW